ncbi:YceD family protein [Polynucleobacter necessarius]|uniref:YceD family protein n=1 Tax=Polynucleobacter necessarius TaxID=576610 RepID=UPI000E09BABF|nr:YceD family protein [Polynucleobacter necessarius]
MKHNQVLLQVELSIEPNALKKVDFCAPQSYQGTGFLSISDLPRVAEEASTIIPGDGFDWSVKTHFEDSPGSEPHQILDLGLKGRLHLVCQRCLQGCAIDLDEKCRFVLVLADVEADAYPIEDEKQEPLVVNQHFNLLETIEDEVLLSLPLIPKHPDGFCEPHTSTFGDEEGEVAANEHENPFNILKNMKKN